VKRAYTWEWLHNIAVVYDGDECLLWPFGRNSAGRGATWEPNKGWRAAHVVVCEVYNGPRPTPDHEAAHSCGRGHDGCVTPKHLRWDTHAGNLADKAKHGTLYQGAAHHKAKLSKADAQYIIDSELAGVDLALYFNVSPTAISYIRRGRNWKSAHV